MRYSPAHVTRSVTLSFFDIMVVFIFSNSRGLVQQLAPRVTSCVRSVQIRWLNVAFNLRQIDEMPPFDLLCSSLLKTLTQNTGVPCM